MDLADILGKTYSQEFFFQIINSITDLVQVVDKNNQVIYQNEAMKEASLATQGPEEGLFDFTVIQRTLETGEVIQQEQVYNGDSYSVKTSPLWDDDGNLVGAVEVYRSNAREKKLHGELVERNRAMSHEMVMAASIQQALLPKKGFMGTVKVGYHFEPLDYISGDLFDVFYIDKDHLAFYICDIVGHGFASGMITMFIHQAMRTLEPDLLLNPGACLSRIQDKFWTLNLDSHYYFTMFYGIYDLANHKLTYANAGHNCPPILKGQGLCMALEVAGRPIMQYDQGLSYESCRISVYPGDQVFLYTDGFLEASNKNKEAYGLGRILSTLKTSSMDLIDHLIKDQENFIWGPVNDDRSALCLEIY